MSPRNLSLFLVFSLLSAVGFSDDKIDFNRDVRPILSDKCFHCHGPDSKNQKSDLRFDSEERLFADYEGVKAVVPGDLKASEMHWRINSDDPDDEMPPRKSNRLLSDEQKKILDEWIKQGAPYAKHWAFEIPRKSELPELTHAWQKSWAKNPIDHFVAKKLYEKGLEPTKPATDETLRRRASLALTGLQPTHEEIANFKNLDSEVDRLLETMDYAERQALRWLDASRYADTDGFQNDAERSNWPWRDWVIKAFQENKPFDEFTIEQLAGDMLENPTGDQILASAFNRNHRQNSEGGALAPEFLVENVIDRVETTSTVWLGLTLGCARCHDHKYDPLSQREFYQMFAYFNNIGEKGIGKGISANPVQKMGSPLMEMPPELSAKIETAIAAVSAAKKSAPDRMTAWAAETVASFEDESGEAKAWFDAKITKATSSGSAKLVKQLDGSYLLTGKKLAKATYTVDVEPKKGQVITGFSIEALPHDSLTKPRQLARSTNGNFVLSELIVKHGGKPVKIKSVTATYSQENYPVKNLLDGNTKTGWAVFGGETKAETVSAYFTLAEPISAGEKDLIQFVFRHESGFGSHNIGRFALGLTEEKNPELHTPDETGVGRQVAAALRIPADKRNAEQKKIVADYFASIDPELAKENAALAAVEKEKIARGFTEVPVMVMKEREGEPVETYLLNRGVYTEPDKSENLPRSLPLAIFSGDPKAMPKDRLELANWMVSRDNPLTARVTVNRMWQDIFGVGLVKSVGDFGVQGEIPEYQELLDWLAVEFIDSGWDVKEMFRLILTSATFQQGSFIEPILFDRDPENRLLSRGSRYRLDGFAIRDVALRASGLLTETVGGAPAKPYQPEGLWNAVSAGAGTRYQPSKGADLYRKSMYTYWKRAVNPPRQIIFDAGGRELCLVNTRRTNTPLQALALMNDVTFVESARHVAERVLTNAELKTDAEKIGHTYKLVTSREVRPEQVKILSDNLGFFRDHFSKNQDGATKFLSAGESKKNEKLDVIEHAAWASVAHLVLNLDETITLE